MKELKISISFVMICIAIVSCNSRADQVNSGTNGETSKTITYDSIKAMNYGADDYGMKTYVMAFLKRGPNREIDPQRANQLQIEHLRNINRMAKEGKLVLAGPFLGNGDLRGIYLFNVSSIAEAEALTQSDPAIQAGSLAMELMEWYGSAALMAVNNIHKTIARKEIFE